MSSAFDAYFSIVRALKVGNQMNWGMTAHLTKLRQQLGLGDEVHQQVLAELGQDPGVAAWEGAGAKRAGTPTAAPAAAAPLPAAPQYGAAPMSAPPPRAKQPKPVRRSDPGLHMAKPVVYDNGHNLVGWVVSIIQEDESRAEAVVTGYNPASNCHVCTSNYGTLEACDTELPLADNPDAFARVRQHEDYFPGADMMMAPTPSMRQSSSFSNPRQPVQRQLSRMPSSRPSMGPGGPSSKLSGPPYGAAALAAKLEDPNTTIEMIVQMMESVIRKEDAFIQQLQGEGVQLDPDFLVAQAERANVARELLAGLS